MKIAVLMVNYNGKKFIPDCLDSLARQTLKPECIVAVDNGSSDGSLEMLREYRGEVTLLEQGKNLGFAEGNNVGWRWIRQNLKVDAIALVNNDTRADPGWLAAMAGALSANPELGSVASCMLLMSDPKRMNDAGDMPLWDGRAVARGRDLPADRYEEDADVFGPCAGAALYRTEALESVAMDECIFDPEFFAYNEDVDLAWRLRRRGWGCRYVASAKILHHHSGTAGRFSTWVLFHGERNRCWTLFRNYSWVLILISPAYTLARLVFALTEGRDGPAVSYRARYSIWQVGWVILTAWGAAILGWPRMLARRWKFGLGWSLAQQWKALRKWGVFRSRTQG